MPPWRRSESSATWRTSGSAARTTTAVAPSVLVAVPYDLDPEILDPDELGLVRRRCTCSTLRDAGALPPTPEHRVHRPRRVRAPRRGRLRAPDGVTHRGRRRRRRPVDRIGRSPSTRDTLRPVATGSALRQLTGAGTPPADHSAASVAGMPGNPLTDPNWAPDLADQITTFIGNVRDKTTNNAIKVVRGVVFGLLGPARRPGRRRAPADLRHPWPAGVHQHLGLSGTERCT